MDGLDAKHLERAMALAERGRGWTSPNPVVGAVIVKAGEIIGEGWHAGPGREHAEVAAIKEVLRRHGKAGVESTAELPETVIRPLCEGTTMYVTLEPCCTQGRTPPCTSALTAGGFGRVVVGAIDPSPGVNGKGLEVLRSSGIQVDLAEGGLAHRARRQNDGLRKTVARGLPFVTYKYAMSLDGRVATDTGDSRWISGAKSRALVHRWRAWSDAVVVGAGTLAADDPQLTARGTEGARQPLRVVVGSGLTLAKESNLVKTLDRGPVLLVCGSDVGEQRLSEVRSWGIEVEVSPCADGRPPDPEWVCRILAGRSVQTVLLEGGPGLAGSWWAAGLIDKVAAFVCPRVVSGQEHREPLRGPGATALEQSLLLQELEVLRIGDDVLISGYTGGPF